MLKIGVFGAYRGMAMIKFCAKFPGTELVAICDKSEEALEKTKKVIEEENANTRLYKDFDEFFKEDMDAVVLANYATEHAPYAIRCLNAGKHVISEVLPALNMAQAVELCEAVEKSGKVYAYAENYCYFLSTNEMYKLYRSGDYGEFEYGEGEYVHDCEPIWPSITYGESGHWRNNLHACFYCTHSIGPLVHITGLRPKSVVGFELPMVERLKNLGARCGSSGLEIITMENGSIVKSLHSLALKREPSAIWYCLYGSKGMMESSRREDGVDGMSTFINDKFTTYQPKPNVENETTKKLNSGHFGGDFYPMYYFVQKILGHEDGKNSIGVYEALDMWMPGHFAYRSVLNGNVPFEIPDLRDKSVRDKYRNDTWCFDPKYANGDLAPSYSKGTPDIPQEVYDRVADMWKKQQEEERAKEQAEKK